MTEHPDVILYLLFESIRGDWSEGIPERADAIIDILPCTTFQDREELKEHMEKMKKSWYDDGIYFDGRTWSRGRKFNYFTLFEHFETLDNLRESNLLKWGISNDGTDRLESNYKTFSPCHDDVMELYNEWKLTQ